MEVQGFVPMDVRPRPRLFLSVDALQKRGKTRFALTAPKPLAYINLDRAFESCEADVQKLAEGAFIADLSGTAMQVSAGQGKLGDQVLEPFRQGAQAALEQINETWRTAYANFRTVVVDTSTRWYDIKKVAAFGKLTQIKPEHYGPVKAEFEQLLYEGLGAGCNVILLHKQGKEYKNDQWTGGYERKGYADTDFVAHARITLTRLDPDERTSEDLGFRALIRDVGTIATGDGEVLENENITFQMVALTIRPDTTPEDWE